MNTTPEVLGNTSSTSGSLVTALRGTKGCFHPVRLWGESVVLANGEIVRSSLTAACRNRRAAIRPPNAYFRRAALLINEKKSLTTASTRIQVQMPRFGWTSKSRLGKAIRQKVRNLSKSLGIEHLEDISKKTLAENAVFDGYQMRGVVGTSLRRSPREHNQHPGSEHFQRCRTTCVGHCSHQPGR
jgi:hypothetical protein